ncbi:MAG: hypothetical protein ACHQ9S_02830 [Candidatus Binatia bacterium]
MRERCQRLEGAEAILPILLWKAAVFLIIVIAFGLIPFRGSHSANIDPDNPPLSTSFSLWDAKHYIYLAENGYRPGRIDNGFAPLYPLAMSTLNFVTGSSVASGLLISNLASGVGLYLFYVFVKRRFGADSAMRSLLLFLAFPTAFYLNLIYTEGLFLLLAMLFFLALHRRAFAAAAVFSFLLPLARPQGIFVIVPFALFLLLEAMEEARWRRASPKDRLVIRLTPRFLYLLVPLLAVAVWLGWMKAATGDAFAPFHAQGAFISQRSLGSLLKPWLPLTNLFIPNLTLHGFTTSVIDRAFFVAFVASLPVVYRRVDLVLFVFCLLMGMEPFLGSYMSYTRYVMLAFPLYIGWGVRFRGWGDYAFYAALFPLLMLQALFVSLHSLNYWVA